MPPKLRPRHFINWITAAIFATAAITLAWIIVRPWFSPAGNNFLELENRIADLQRQIKKNRRELGAAVASYRPTAKQSIFDLGHSPVPILQRLPGVAAVKNLLPVKNPTHRIIHLRDWHYVSQADFAAGINDQTPIPLAPKEIDLRYEGFLLEVELVHMEQMALLTCLSKHHGLTEIWSEGLTKKELPAFEEMIATLKQFEKDFAALQ